MNELDLRTLYPAIPWDEPVIVKVIGKQITRWSCRYCISIRGLDGKAVSTSPFAFDTREEAVLHIESTHAYVGGGDDGRA